MAGRSRETVRYLDYGKISAAVFSFLQDPILGKSLSGEHGKYTEAYRQRYFEMSKLLRTVSTKGDTEYGVSKELTELVGNVIRNSRIAVQLLPEADQVFHRILEHIKAGGYKLYLGDVEIPIEDFEELALSGELPTILSQARAEGPRVDVFKNMKLLAHMSSANTAYVTKAYSPRSDTLHYFVGISDEFYAKFRNEHYKDAPEKLAKAMSTVVAHELKHAFEGDLEESVNKRYKNMSPNDLNVTADSRINSTLLRKYRDDAEALLGVIGIRGSTLHQFANIFPLVEAAWRAYKREDTSVDAFIAHYIDAYKEMGQSLDVDVIMSQFQGVDNKWVSTFVENIKKHAPDGFGAFVEDIKKRSMKLLDRLVQAETISKEAYNAYKKAFDSENFIDFFHAYRTDMINFEENPEHKTLQYPLWNDVWDRLNTLLPEPPGGKGRGRGRGRPRPGSPDDPFEKGKPWEPPDDDDFYREVPKKKSNDLESDLDRVTSDIRNKVDDPETRNPGLGSMRIFRDLPQVPFDRALYNTIQDAWRVTAGFERQELVQEVIKAVKGTDITTKTTFDAITGRPKGMTPPAKGVLYYDENPEPDNILFAIFDESASVGDEELAAAKDAIMKMCGDRYTVVIGVSHADDFRQATVKVYNPKAEPALRKKLADSFRRRYATGGTANFERWVFDLDDVLADPSVYDMINSALAAGQVTTEGGKLMNADSLLRMWKEGKVRGIVLTDGHLFSRTPSEEELKKYTDVARRVSQVVSTDGTADRVPLAFISTTGTTHGPWSGISSDIVNRLIRWFKVR